MARSEVEVAIIGGGAAGIAAGRRLVAAGVDCLVIEARPRLGGRAWTAHEAGTAIDLGCGWLHSAEGNPWLEIAEAAGRSIDRTPAPWMREGITAGFPAAEQAEFRKAMQAFYGRLAAIEARAADVPAAEFLEPGGRWNPLIDAVGTYIAGAELERVSAADLHAYADSGVNWRVVDGYGAVIAAHGAGLPAVLGCQVLRIDHGGARLRIETAKGTIVAAEAIVTLPSQVLAEGGIAFKPALPEKVQAAAGLPLGLADKLFISLDDPHEFDEDSRLFGNIRRTRTAAYHVRPFGRAQIEAYFGGSLAADLEREGAAAFFDFASSELTALFGSGFARRLEPIRMHRWGADPLARGSYSYAAPGMAGCRRTLAAPVDGRLFFAGEACSEADFSTAHGAYRTGVAAAEAVIAAR